MARSALLVTLAGAMVILGGWSAWRPIDAAAPAAGETVGWPGRAESLEVRIESMVDRLASPEWSVREAAYEELLALPMPEAQPFLVDRLERGGLDPEQRHRLVDVACRRLTEQQRGALGIRMGWIRGGRVEGMRVDALVPGLPAIKVLRVGDIIEQVNDEPLLDRDSLGEIVQSLKPGTSVRLRVARPVLDETGRPRRDRNGLPVTRPIDVSLKLASMDELEAAEAAMAEQGEMGAMRNMRSNRVQHEREITARIVRQEVIGPAATVVRLPPVPEGARGVAFTALLSELERSLRELELVDRSSSESEELIRTTARAIELLRIRERESGVTAQDRRRLDIADLQRARLLVGDETWGIGPGGADERAPER